MIEDLLKANKISPEEYDIWMLYRANDIGYRVLNKAMFDTYMDEPNNNEFKNAGFAFYDGRRSVFRDIQKILLKIEKLLEKEALNDTK